MRTKLSDWKVGEKVVFLNCHSNQTSEEFVISVGRKFIGIGMEGAEHPRYRFEYKGSELRCVGGYTHSLYTPEEYKLKVEYNHAYTSVRSELDHMWGPNKWTEENIKRLGQILEIMKAIKA